MNRRGFFKAAAGLATMPLALPVALPAAAAPAAAATIKTQFAEALTDTGHTHSLCVDELASHTHGVGLRGYETGRGVFGRPGT